MSKNTQFTILRTCNHYLKVVLTLKVEFENIFYDIFLDLKNIYLNIMVSKFL
jgi:hypothetical protein